MTIPLPADIAARLKHQLDDGLILVGELTRVTNYQGGPDQVFLLLDAISPQTAQRIRRLVEGEKDAPKERLGSPGRLSAS